MARSFRTTIIPAVMAVLALALAACGGGATGGGEEVVPLSPQLQPVYDKAKTEPPLTWYSSQDPERNDAVVAAFRAQYPDVRIESLRLATGALATRYTQERRAGAVTAGVITLADPNFVVQARRENWLQPIDRAQVPGVTRLPGRFFDGAVATTGISVLGIAYNTSEVTAPPRTWNDALGPQYRGRILLGDPRNVPSYLALSRILTEKVSADYLTALAAQQPRLVDSMVPGTQQLAAGEGALALPNVLSVVTPLKDKGAPIDFVVPEPTTGNEFASMISSGTASPDTARLLYDFLLTDAGQRAFNGPAGSSPISGVAGTAPLPAGYVDPAITRLPEVRADLLRRLDLQ